MFDGSFNPANQRPDGGGKNWTAVVEPSAKPGCVTDVVAKAPGLLLTYSAVLAQENIAPSVRLALDAPEHQNKQIDVLDTSWLMRYRMHAVPTPGHLAGGETVSGFRFRSTEQAKTAAYDRGQLWLQRNAKSIASIKARGGRVIDFKQVIEAPAFGEVLAELRSMHDRGQQVVMWLH